MKLSLTHFIKNVTTATTRVALKASVTQTPSFIVQAKPGNTDRIFVGNSTVSSSDYMISLGPGEAFEFTASLHGAGIAHDKWDLAEVYIDSVVNGEGVSVGYATRS